VATDERAAREDARARLVPAIAQMVGTRDFRATFAAATGRSDEHTIIVALPDDRMGYVFDRIRDAQGCAAVLVAPCGDEYEIAEMWPASDARVAVAAEDDSLTPVDDECEVSFFFEYLHQAGTVVVSRITARLIDRETPELV
jgi:hypothetical protein